LILILLSAEAASAQTPSDDAREHYRKGTAAYNLGKYQDAAREYELAYEATLDPAFLFNLAQAYRLAGEQRKAGLAYRSYLRSSPDGEKRDIAAAKLKDIERILNKEDAKVALPTAAPSASVPSVVQVAPSPSSTPEVTALQTSEPKGRWTESTQAESVPIYRRWPFWLATAAALGALVTVVIIESRPSSMPSPSASLGTMRF
jgi:tetratricopeptide (TPR) repeat protein